MRQLPCYLCRLSDGDDAHMCLEKYYLDYGYWFKLICFGKKYSNVRDTNRYRLELPSGGVEKLLTHFKIRGRTRM